MKQRKWPFSVIIILTLILMGCSNNHQSQSTSTKPAIEVTIAAAVSLKDVLNEVQRNYESKNPNVKLLINFGGSGSLQRQIEQGAPIDIFIPADSKYLESLQASNLINSTSRKNLANNTLVLVVPKSSNVELGSFDELGQQVVNRVAMGEPASVPAGHYGMQVFEKLGIWEKVRSKAVYAKDVRSVLSYVETGNVDVGVVYKTDALVSNKVKITAMAPSELQEPIIYTAAVLTGAKQQEAAEDVVAYLASDEGKMIFKKYGFSK